MIEFWAVLGRTCFDEAFEKGIFDQTDPTATFLQLTTLENFLISQNLRLARWEVMNINRIYSQRWDGTRKIFFRLLSDDATLVQLRAAASGATGGSLNLSFPDKQEFCAIFGLSCIDTEFRTNVYNASKADPADISDLDTLLRKGVGGPKFFGITDAELVIVNKFIRASGVVTLLDAMHNERWVQPVVERVFGACDAGYTPKGFGFISQQDLALFLDQKPDIAKQLRDAKAII